MSDEIPVIEETAPETPTPIVDPVTDVIVKAKALLEKMVAQSTSLDSARIMTLIAGDAAVKAQDDLASAQEDEVMAHVDLDNSIDALKSILDSIR